MITLPIEEEAKKELKDVDANFKAFLWREISRIREAEINRDYVTAINHATSLVVYLPVEVKKRLKEKSKTIRRDLEEAAISIRGSNFFSQSLNRTKVVRRMSQIFLQEFMDTLSSSLDEREQYMEKQRRAIPTGFE